MLKILHLHDSGLDDPRIVNNAVTGKKVGYEQYFCGSYMKPTLDVSVFTQMKWIEFSEEARVAKHFIPFVERYWKWYPYPTHAIWLEKHFKEVIDEIRPDIIHAHNIFAAHYALPFGIPMVLDDHEFYSLHAVAKHEGDTGLHGRMRLKVKHNRWSEWEREIGERCPIITVTPAIAEHHKRYCSHVFVIPNYPSKDTIKFTGFSSCSMGNVCSAYIGADLISKPYPIRNITGLHEIFDLNTNVGRLVRIGVDSPNTARIRSYGYIPLKDAYRIFQEQCHIGLLPWKKHWFHKYCCPNKVYEYAHCGLWLITIEDLTAVTSDFDPLCDKVESLEELRQMLEYYDTHPEELNDKRKATLEHARLNFIWEKEEHKILEAYKLA